MNEGKTIGDNMSSVAGFLDVLEEQYGEEIKGNGANANPDNMFANIEQTFKMAGQIAEVVKDQNFESGKASIENQITAVKEVLTNKDFDGGLKASDIADVRARLGLEGNER